MVGPPSVVARARSAVRLALTRRLTDLADAPAGDLSPLIQVGVSGGADSLALLVTTVWVAQRMGLEVEAVIIDHALQEDSAAVAEQARTAAEHLGAAATILRAQIDADAPGGVENAAREVRHQLLETHREERGALAVLLAHTLDDQAEQVLMGLARGGGPRAIAGMPRSRGPLLRPFLGNGRDERTALRRADTEEICRLHHLEWWEDPMNQNTALLRARVRHELMPQLREVLGEQIDENLARAADLVRVDEEHLDSLASEVLESLQREAPDAREDGDLLLLDVHALLAEPEAVRTRVLRDASRRAQKAAGAASGKSVLRRQVVAVDALVVSWHGQAAIPLPGRIEVARRDGLLVWRRSRP